MTSRAPRMTIDDLGAYYVYGDGSIWKLTVYAAEPTATLECIEGHTRGNRVGGVVGAPIFDGFRRLVAEGEG